MLRSVNEIPGYRWGGLDSTRILGHLWGVFCPSALRPRGRPKRATQQPQKLAGLLP